VQPSVPISTKPIRCAIYVRKSTEEGLEQDFNSLDAQRESAEAYILSQRHEQWVTLPRRYDDGGFTGANTDRPGLQGLLADIDAGLVDCVAVYKVDRLSRSLLDFARIMEVFDRRGVSFVSVTQQFNTTSPMGRLTLNILLSFAQFEREIISERTRDKMVAARRRGKWTGGFPALGYDADPLTRKLIVNEVEAEQVRGIFALFLQNQSLADTLDEMERRGWKTKGWTTRKSKQRIGLRFDRPALIRVLTNVLYIGEVRHAGSVYPGEQSALVDREAWTNVNNLLEKRKRPSGRERQPQSPLLERRLVCAVCGSQMVHGYTTKGGRRYRYYQCQIARKQGAKTCPGQTVAARRIEVAVMNALSELIVKGVGKAIAESLGSSAPGGDPMVTRQQHTLLDEAIAQIRYDHRTEGAHIRLQQNVRNSEAEIFVTIRKDPSGKRYHPSSHSLSAVSLPQIARTMALAIRFEEMLERGVVRNYPDLARSAGVSTTRISQILKLRRLAPSIQERLLLLNSDAKYVSEPILRRISEEIDWKQQIDVFNELCDARDIPAESTDKIGRRPSRKGVSQAG